MPLQKNQSQKRLRPILVPVFRRVPLLALFVGCMWFSSFSMAAQANNSGSDDSLRQGLPGRRVSGGSR